MNASGQPAKNNNYRLQIDTLTKKGDSTLAKIMAFHNDTLVEEKTAYLFPDSIKIARFRLTGNLFKKTIYVDRLIKHGKTIQYSKDEKKKIDEYKYDKIISTLYYDKSNKEISKDKFVGDNIRIGPCGTITGEYIIQGKRK